ncbi:hypothetical protein OAR97_01170 [Arcobacteraceae bacterium]|nr:hypothetical protein [Arcobacteraceae bacterium]
MTKKQQELYRIITNQMFDFNEDFHKDFTIERIEKIEDNKLKYLLENITVDKDNIVKRKGFVTYAKFVYYADKMIEEELENAMLPNHSKVEELYKKRELLLNTIETQTNTLSEKNQLVEDLKNKKIMFKDNGKNILDEIDYFIIERFGFFNFFDQNKNYMIKEQIDDFYKEFMQAKLLSKNNNTVQLINETKTK